jgi:hypothetical protein
MDQRYGNVQGLLQEMKKCLQMMELSDAVDKDDKQVAEIMAAFRNRIEELEQIASYPSWIKQ